MAVLKEFACAAHGPFEEMVNGDETPRCPHGCSKRFVTREIRTPAATRGAVTGTLDQMQKGIADEFKLRDIKVDKEPGTSVMDNLRRSDPTKAGAFWGNPSKMNLGEFKATSALTKMAQPTPTQIDGRYKGSISEVDA